MDWEVVRVDCAERLEALVTEVVASMDNLVALASVAAVEETSDEGVGDGVGETRATLEVEPVLDVVVAASAVREDEGSVGDGHREPQIDHGGLMIPRLPLSSYHALDSR